MNVSYKWSTTLTQMDSAWLIVAQHPAVEKGEHKKNMEIRQIWTRAYKKNRTYFVNYVGTNDSLPQWLHLEEFLGHLSFRTPVQVEQWSTSENSIIMFSNAIKDSYICLKNEGSRSTFAMHLFFYLKHKCIFNILFLCAPSNLHNYLGLTDYRNTINVVFDKDEYVGRT